MESVFWLNVPIVGARSSPGSAWSPRAGIRSPGAFDLVGAALSVATLVTLVFGIIEATPRGWADALVLGCFAVAAVLGVAFVAWERRVEAPMLPLTFFRDPRFSVASLGIGIVFFAMMGTIFAFTQYLQFARGLSALEAGAAMLPLALGLVIGAGASSRLTGISAASASSPAACSAWRPCSARACSGRPTWRRSSSGSSASASRCRWAPPWLPPPTRS